MTEDLTPSSGTRRTRADKHMCPGKPGQRPVSAGSEVGAIVIIVALALVALLGLVALVVDLGGLYDHDRDLQTVADAAVLAGAQELIYSGGNAAAARQKATEYAHKNTRDDPGTPGSSVVWANLKWVPPPAIDERSVEAWLHEDHVPFLFARALGKTEGAVKAHARAEVKYVTGIDKLFPAAINYMNPEYFRFVFKSSGGTEVARFDLGDPDGDGTFDTVENRVPSAGITPQAAGLYAISLQAIDSDGEVGIELSDIGLWRAANRADPKEKLYRVSLYRQMDGATATVRAEAAPTVTNATLSARLGNTNFTLTKQGDGTYLGTVAVPTKISNEGYDTADLKIKDLAGNDAVARLLVFHEDVPLKYLMFFPSLYDGYEGYSGFVGQTAQPRATVVARVLNFGDHYVMKLGNQAGSGLYSGNWRLADIYRRVNTRDEIGTVPIPDTWVLNNPLQIGGPLLPETGATTGQVQQGLHDRLSGRSPTYTQAQLERMAANNQAAVIPPDDPYYVIVPIVEFTSLHGTSRPYEIAVFAGFYITDYSKAGDIGGVFIRSVAPGEWSDTPPGRIYVETVVLTK